MLLTHVILIKREGFMIKNFEEERQNNDEYVKTNEARGATVALFNAIYENDTDKMEAALSAGADIKAHREDDDKSMGVVEYLIKYGPKDLDSWETKEIEYNKKNGYLVRMLNILQNYNVDILEDKPLSGFGGNYENHFAQVIINRSLKEISHEPQKWAEQTASSFGDSWIEHAVNTGNIDIAEQLIRSTNTKSLPWGLLESDNGQSILTLAVYSKNEDLINMLFDNINENNVNMSLDKAKPWSMATEMFSLLDNASYPMRENIKSAIEKLVEKGADLNQVREEYLNATKQSIDSKNVAGKVMSIMELSSLDVSDKNKNSFKIK